MAKQTQNTNLLHHYTSVSGFNGIITSHSLRMTESNFLNDPSDCRLFTLLIEKYLTKDTIDSIFSETIQKYKIPSNHVKQITTLLQEGKCDFISYIRYIHDHISLYVVSFTTNDNDDAMTMWNYYGKDGMEITFDKDELLDLLRKTLNFTNEYLTESKVIYIPNNNKLDDIEVPNFSDFILLNNECGNIFKKHEETVRKSMESSDEPNLYDIHSLTNFIRAYFKSYLLTLVFLLRNENITVNTPTEQIFQNVFANDSSLYDDLLWKHDMSLYMLVLSALIKHETYAYEKEHRIVYFKYDLNYRRKGDFTIKELPSGNFLCPYITLSEQEENKDSFFNSMKKVTISPYACNMPLNAEKYCKELIKYLSNTKFTNKTDNNYEPHTDIAINRTTGIDVKYSERIIRW